MTGPQFFISYDETYHKAAAALHERLLRELRGTFGRDIDIFLDHRDIAGGDEWRKQIDDGLASLNVLIALVNDAFVTRPYCRYEFDAVRQRQASGEPCRIVTVRFQGDSEVYRSSSDAASRVEAADRLYLAALGEDERRMVSALREVQCVDGVALREAEPDSRDYNTALYGLTRAVAQQYREVRAAQNQGVAAGEGTAPKSPPGPRIPMTAVAATAGVLLLAVLGAWVGGLFGGGSDGGKGNGGEETTIVVPNGPVWTAAGLTVLTNAAAAVAIAYREGKDGADTANPLDQIQPGTDRPEAGLDGQIFQACIKGQRWLKYPVPGNIEAMVSAQSLGLPPGC